MRSTLSAVAAAAAFAVAALGLTAGASADYVLEIDTDSADDGVLTYHPNFSFGNDQTTASQSGPSTAVGMTGGDSIFGGDSSTSDTYIYTYTPSVDGANRSFAAGTELNNDGHIASGIAAGGSGLYAVYATWPFTSNVSGDGISTFTLSDGTSTIFTTPIDQNAGGSGTGDEWVLLGNAELDADTTYTLTQEAGNSLFVSQRAAGVLFTVVPEPTSLGLAGIAGLGLLRRRRA